MHLTRRERRLAAGLGVGIILWSLHVMVVKPTGARIRTLERILPEKQHELRELQARIDEYARLRDGSERFRAKMAAQDPEFQLLPFLEELLENHGLAKHVSNMVLNTVQLQPHYSETIVEIKLENASLKQLIDFVMAVESSDALAHVGSLHIHTAPENEASLHSTVQIHRPQLNPNALVADFGPIR